MAIEMSEKTDQLIPALFEVSKEIEPIQKTIRNDFLGSKYASLPDVLAAIKPILEKQNLLMSGMITSPDTTGIQITFEILHISGQYKRFSGCFPAEPKKGISNVQSAGASITYALRYLIGSFFMIPFESDDDGNKRPPAKPKVQPNTQALDIIKKGLIEAVNKSKIEQSTKISRIDWVNRTNEITTLKKAGEKWGI